METNYTQMANDFLTKTNVKITIEYYRYGKHFVNDNTDRHIFTVTLSRCGKKHSFKFGQSIAQGRNKPSAYDILACLQKYDIGSFEDFCSEFGYTHNSINRTIYNAVCKEFEMVSDIWSDEEIEELQEIY